ncbi:MAG: hypothetical protein G01um101418_310 [Parcubacteria group bacterium Gr01-1014_18]|nr:MAG: hypothetical protein Greene041636_314 [Parcubacteria group bacterium Greene0416_36]TSC81170.1 MAG: hypothetical protein G01um101418_310 [Parcubacteria group bacterium Gr01-1014_18]TSC99167.1 MAG: hypothetical protein Greene101420_312 [Parcubacteria group bacterium Greene1014_20]TSD07475.1 MAG: hypothetical protein Greene07142_174 [Parcubacteria group bacterium Greene0714_2]
MRKKLIQIIFTVFSILISVGLCVAPMPVKAQIIPTPSCPSYVGGRSVPNTEYGFCDFFKVGISLANVLWTLVGGIVVFMIVVGAFFWVTSAGNSSQVEKGKEIIKSAFIGLFIMLAAYQIVGFVFASLLLGSVSEEKTEALKFEGVWENGVWNFKPIFDKCKCPIVEPYKHPTDGTIQEGKAGDFTK